MRFTLLVAVALGAACGSNDPQKDLSQPPTPDLAVPDATVDRGPAPDEGVPKNSGKICASASECAPGDECRAFFGSTKKMCVSPCTPGQSCAVPSPVKNAAGCYLQVGTNYYCVWFCEYTGKKYECPVANAYECYQPDQAQPGLKVCVPK
jgi:hypothetical protein